MSPVVTRVRSLPWARIGRTAIVIAAAVVGSLTAASAFGAVTGKVGPGQVEMRTTFDPRGETILEAAPIGRMRADTHTAPISTRMRVESIDLAALERLGAKGVGASTVADEARGDAVSLARTHAAKLAFMAAIGGAIGGGLAARTRWKGALIGMGTGLAVVGALGLWIARDWDPDAFGNGRYEGPIASAPHLLDAGVANLTEFDAVRDRIGALSERIASLYQVSITEDVRASDGETVILHVSDLHSNPIGLELVNTLAEQFDADAILDTGDLTSFGVAVEANVINLIDDIGVPYLWVAGNHDALAIRTAMQGLSGVTALDGNVVTIGQVRITGWPDPTFTADDPDATASEANDQKYDGQQARIASELERLDVDLVAVHNPRQADAVLGLVDTVAAGHTHKTTATATDGTLVLTVGSTGATGLGSLTIEADKPYEAELLRYRGSELVAVDVVRVFGVDGNFSIERFRVTRDANGDLSI